jgi:hypothetical protein
MNIHIHLKKAQWEAATKKFKIMFHYITPPPGVGLRGHEQQCTNPWRQVTVATKVYTVAPNACGSSK